jgi:hypothetical protein
MDASLGGRCSGLSGVDFHRPCNGQANPTLKLPVTIGVLLGMDMGIGLDDRINSASP